LCLQVSTHSAQGKLLCIPDRVPFRMTWDMVDGMRKCGTQGIFQDCAEETLRVLCDRSDVILTVLEVFKHDPLHSWYVHFSLPSLHLTLTNLHNRTASELKCKTTLPELPGTALVPSPQTYRAGRISACYAAPIKTAASNSPTTLHCSLTSSSHCQTGAL